MPKRVLELYAVIIATIACSSPSGSRPAPKTETVSPTPLAPACESPVLVVGEGKDPTTVCDPPADLTIVDLRDRWTPRLFAPAADGREPAFRATYLALAAEQDANGKPLPAISALTELYGVVPSFAIVRRRFTETSRYACHAKLDASPIAKLTRPYGEEHARLVRHHLFQRRVHGARLEKAKTQRNVAAYAAFAGDKELGAIYEQWRVADELIAGIEAAQRHLVCEGVLADKHVDGSFSWSMGMGLELYQRRNFLIPNSRLDAETRAAFALDPHELDFRLALRILRERIVDATGLVEDGTAGTGPQPILGRMLDPEPMRGPRGYGRPLPNGAPDLIGAATEVAAKQLGWTSPAAAQAFLAKYPDGMRVALRLPPPPAYHSEHMQLSAEIDRGDVWYDEAPQPRVAWKRPILVVYAHDGATKRPLIRWPTTIGGWSDVKIGGRIVKRWKESDVGPRQWRQLFAAPTWLPPASTPDSELVKWRGAGKWEVKSSIVGPGPHAAFGMMLLPHHAAVKNAEGRTVLVTNGIGTHGSAVVTSILNGTSHGCHRLYNQLAVRLGSFLLHHRKHAVKGQQAERYRRTLYAGGVHQMKIDTRGFLYELTPPISVNVLPGNIRSPRKVPPLGAAPAGAN